jgi:hypothetical protein
MKRKLLIMLVAIMSMATAQAQVKAFIGSVSANGMLYTNGFDDVAIKITSVVSDKFDLTDKLEQVKNYVYTDLANDLPFTIVPEATVLGNEGFQSFVKERDSNGLNNIREEDRTRIALEGYLKHFIHKKDIMAQAIDYFSADEANALLFIEIDCALTAKFLIAGSGSACARVKIRLQLEDKNNKTLMQVFSQGLSEQSFGIAAGQIVNNRDNIPVGLNEAMESALNDMKGNMPKAIKKFEKKLVKYKYK